MGRLEDRLLGHPVHGQISAARSALNSLADSAREAADSTAPEGSVRRAGEALDYVGGLLAAADPGLVWQGLLDGLQSHANQIQSYAAQLPSQPQMVGAIDQATEALIGLSAQLAGAIRFTRTTAKRLNAQIGRTLAATVQELR